LGHTDGFAVPPSELSSPRVERGCSAPTAPVTVYPSPVMKESVTAGATAPHFLVHNEGDHVAVAVQDVEPGRRRAVFLDSDREVEIDVVEAVPLGHKVALAELGEGVPVIEYEVPIGMTRRPVTSGQLVHVHNLRSARWLRSQ